MSEKMKPVNANAGVLVSGEFAVFRTAKYEHLVPAEFVKRGRDVMAAVNVAPPWVRWTLVSEGLGAR